MKEAIIAGLVLLLGTVLILCTSMSDVSMSNAYTQRVTLDNAKSIPSTISNTLSKVEDKGFIVTRVRTSYNFLTGSYTVEVGGREPEQFTSLDK